MVIQGSCKITGRGERGTKEPLRVVDPAARSPTGVAARVHVDVLLFEHPAVLRFTAYWSRAELRMGEQPIATPMRAADQGIQLLNTPDKRPCLCPMMQEDVGHS